MAQSIPNVNTPHPCICHLVGPGGEEFVIKPLPGGGAFINSSRSGYHRSFFNISICLIRIFLTHYALKQYVWFSIHHHPTPQFFLHPSKKLLPINGIVNASFEQFKGKDTFTQDTLWANGSSSSISIYTRNYITFTWLSQESCLKLN